MYIYIFIYTRITHVHTYIKMHLLTNPRSIYPGTLAIFAKLQVVTSHLGVSTLCDSVQP